MNERFAAEPTTCDSVIEIKHLLEKFGPVTGRYLATYPAQGWEELLHTHIAEWTDVEREKVKTLLRRAKEARVFIRSRGINYEAAETWVRNAVRTQASDLRFDGVVVSRSSAGEFKCIEDFELPPTAAEPVSAHKGEYVRVSRTLLLASPELHFIDAYLDPCDRDRQVVLIEMLREASRGQCQSAYIWMNESRLKRSLDETAIALGRTARVAGFAEPRQLHLRAFTDAGRNIKVHDRYLLSLYGAIRFEHGFQELTGKRTAKIVPESSLSHLQLVELFLEGANDLGVQELLVNLK